MNVRQIVLLMPISYYFDRLEWEMATLLFSNSQAPAICCRFKPLIFSPSFHSFTENAIHMIIHCSLDLLLLGRTEKNVLIFVVVVLFIVCCLHKWFFIWDKSYFQHTMPQKFINHCGKRRRRRRRKKIDQRKVIIFHVCIVEVRYVNRSCFYYYRSLAASHTHHRNEFIWYFLCPRT